jgi:prepilin-type N-terminal cleavage/methylation domain-containing protein
MEKQNHRDGFTLVELAIVLVIIGLVVGGVIVGQAIIEQAKMRSQINQIKNFEEARNTFLLKYGQNPGDISNAMRFFQTSSGNGDGKISEFDVPFTLTDILTMITYMDNQETLIFWQHLSLSGLITGDYNGYTPGFYNSLAGGSNRQAKTVVGENIPRGKINGACIDIEYSEGPYLSPGSQGTVVPRPNFGGYYNYYMIAKDTTLSGGEENCAANLFTSEEAFLFDQKVDDGVPDRGRVSGMDSRAETAGGEVAAPCITSGAYDFTIQEKNCVVAYGFIK